MVPTAPSSRHTRCVAGADSYVDATVPTAAPWEGSAAQTYAETAIALRDHLAGEGQHTLAARLRATASTVESLAAWQQGLRDELARTLAQVMTSSEAVLVRVRGTRPADSDALMAAVVAAAEIGAVLLLVAQEAAEAGRDVLREAGSWEELPYRAPAHTGPTGHDRIIGLS